MAQFAVACQPVPPRVPQGLGGPLARPQRSAGVARMGLSSLALGQCHDIDLILLSAGRVVHDGAADFADGAAGSACRGVAGCPFAGERQDGDGGEWTTVIQEAARAGDQPSRVLAVDAVDAVDAIGAIGAIGAHEPGDPEIRR
ncbi:hypothetical protein [Streptomyces sp. JW3]|uniref:hypothetical protein n=1 Tax=Streptomyces sp. JW3 TaxID=3456955 RepID=UPI003FA4759A